MRLAPSFALAFALSVAFTAPPARADDAAAARAVTEARALVARGNSAGALKLLEAQSKATGAAGRRVRLLLGEVRIATGHRRDAEEPLMKIIEEYNDDKIPDGDAEGLAVAARAAHLLRAAKDANTLFNKSERADKKRVETLIWRGELFLEKYDPGHAEEVLREALQIEPKNAEVLVLLARVKLEQALDLEGADALLTKARDADPKNPSVYAVRAGLALRELEIALAEKSIAEGMALNPNDLELWTMKAASRYLAGDRKGFEAAKRETFSRNPELSRFYVVLGDIAEWEHRYDDIVQMMKEAVALDPDDARAWADLGLTQLRAGDEANGLKSLERAWSKDKFNVRVFNTLNLYEKTIAAEYESLKGPAFDLRWPKAEGKVLARYVPRLLGQAWGSMKARYGFVPSSPIAVELYGSRESFSVRTSGLPNIGIQGVCFGRVMAAMSPKSESFNWGNVVWHELGHVFAIQLSKNKVPRWFTEGLSEYETIARRPEWSRELDPQLYSALAKNKLPSAAAMNRAFTHAEDGLDVSVAYYAASQMMVFTVETFGMPKVAEALRLYGQDLRTEEVLPRAFGVSVADYDARFRAWAMGRLARYANQYVFDLRGKPEEAARDAVKARPTDAAAHVGLALSLLRGHKLDEAKKALAEALRLDPKSKDALFVAGKIAEGEKDVAVYEGYLDQLEKVGGDGYQLRIARADLAESKKDKAGQRAHLEAAHAFDPGQSEPLKGLVDLAREEKREGDLLPLLKTLAPLDQHDRRIWRALLEKQVEAKAWADAVVTGESALYVDVLEGKTHLLYARALAAIGDHAAAVYELESAKLCEGMKPEVAKDVDALLAEETPKLGGKTPAPR